MIGSPRSDARVYGAPPRLDALGMLGFDRVAKPRHDELRIALRAKLEQRLRRLVPGVHGETERSPVDGKKGPAAQQRERLECVRGPEMDVTPSRMERSDLEHHEVEVQLERDVVRDVQARVRRTRSAGSA